MIVMCITDRFNQPDYRVYSEVEQLHFKASDQEDFDSEFKSVCWFYKDDFDPPLLCSQLHPFGVDFNKEGAQKFQSLISEITLCHFPVHKGFSYLKSLAFYNFSL